MVSDTPWEMLARAVIVQAANDWRNNSKSGEAVSEGYTRADIEKFFRSDYFKILSAISGETLLELLREEERMEKMGKAGFRRRKQKVFSVA